jgi:hypothetical protein
MLMFCIWFCCSRLTIGNHQLTNIRQLLNFRVEQLYFSRERKNRMTFVFFGFVFCFFVLPSLCQWFSLRMAKRERRNEGDVVYWSTPVSERTETAERERGDERIQLQLCKCPDVPPPVFYAFGLVRDVELRQIPFLSIHPTLWKLAFTIPTPPLWLLFYTK